MHTPVRILALGILTTLTNVQAQNLDFGEAWWAETWPDGVQRVNIVCGKDYFDPSKIVVKAAVPVELAVSGEGGSSQNFVIDVPGPKPINANTPLTAQQAKFGFQPGSPGNYVAKCQDTAGPPDAALQRRKQGVIIVIP